MKFRLWSGFLGLGWFVACKYGKEPSGSMKDAEFFNL
jgi:hypothetical protein